MTDRGFVPSWLVDVHYLSEKAAKQWKALKALREAFTVPSVFMADNLFAFSRSLSFLTDQKFMDAFMGAQPDRTEKAQVWRKHTLYWAAQRAMALPGDFVEAACYKGFTARVLCNALDLRAAGKCFWLYDMLDNADSHRLEAHSPDLYAEVMQRFAADPVRVVKGRLPDCLSTESPAAISLLHIDMNNAPAEIGTLKVLWDRIATGGTIVLDDYGWSGYREQTQAFNEWFAAHHAPVLEMPTGQGVVIKP